MRMGMDEPGHAEKEVVERRGHDIEFAESAGLAIDRLPQNNAEADIAQEALERALNNLSFNEQEKILFDLHGIDTTPTVCEMSKLKELEKELSLIQKKPAFERARYLNPSFVDNSSFRLMFLRGEKFDAKQAAELMVYHFHIKKELFGDGLILARDIRLLDLRPCDLECVKSGFLQICPSKDAAGRTVFFAEPMLKTSNDMLTMHRAMWYMIMCGLKDEETQKKGIVVIFCNYNNHVEDLDTIRQLRRVHVGLPFWMAGIHYCYSNPSLRPFITGFQMFLPDSNRFRFRTHFGDIKEVMSTLQGYGIPVNEKYPMECSTGRWCVKCHHEWVKRQEEKEAKALPSIVPSAPVDAPVIVPGKFDVLFGKGKKARIHTGTLRCAYLVEMNRERYDNAKKYEKTAIADHIIAMIHDSHGRFLKWEKDGWVEVEHKAAREKVSHFFRQLRSKTSAASSVKVEDDFFLD